ncbi:MAG TPA: SBBP repeat-containing protein [Bryobacteraceae bacterium]|nr:SBBP repeat-containing protein [Bryobacteraceae bacterium]
MRIAIVTLFLAGAPGILAAQQECSLPLFFFPDGTDSLVQYLVQTPDVSARFRADGAVFQTGHRRVRVRFAGASHDVSLEGREPLQAKVNFFLGNDNWRRDVATYAGVVYHGLYPGIDMSFGGTGRHVKSEFVVAPGGDPGLILLEYSEPVEVDAGGDLVAGDFRESAPEIYQQNGSVRERISGRYKLLGPKTVGFEIGRYDPSRALVIDPTVSFSTYLGGSGLTSINGVAVDGSGDLYVTGWTEALNFPTDGPVQAANQGGVDVIVAKLNPSGSALLYATYIGGRSDDKGAAIAVDTLGQAYVTGSTSSTNFPLVSSNRSTLGGSTAAFALKLSAAGNALLYSGYLGGTTYDLGTAIAVDSNGSAYISGDTQSANFPVQSPVQPFIGGGTDAFITKLNPSGAIVFSTYLGGSANEHAGGIAVDALGDIFVAGGTASANFPTVSALQSALAGTQDAFVTKISYSGTIAFSTYLGGSGGPPQQANGIALDSAGNAYVAGVTVSANFPVTAGAFQTAIAGPQNAFVTKLTATGTPVYSTYLGGASYDWGSGIRVSAAGSAYISGYTASLNFPQAGSLQPSLGGLYDAFISELNAAGNGLVFSTFFGGTGSDAANAIALDASVNIFVGGQTSSSNFPLTNPIQSALASASTGWVARLGVSASPPTTPAVLSISPASGSGSSVTFTASFSDSGGGSTLTAAALLVNASASTGYGCYVSYNPGLNVFSLYNDAGTAVLSTVTPGGASAQNGQCALNGVGSSASVSGSSLSVTYSLAFQPPFAGPKTLYLSASDANSNTGWVAEGAYSVTVAPGTPQVGSVSPNAGSGTGATFSFVYSDTVYADNLTSVAFLFNSSVTFTNACYVVYNLTSNTVSLATDNNQSATSVTLGSSTALQNSQCVVSGTSAAQSGLSIIFTANVYFKGSFNGTQNIYMYAAVGSLNTGWVLAGTFGAANGGNPQAAGSVPSSGSGPGERFTFTIADPGGASYLTYGAILFASTFNNLNACLLEWDGVANTISLTYDNPASGQTPFPPGSNNIATNSQCTMNALNSTIVRGATQVLITLDLTFNSGFYGTKNIYLYAAEGSLYKSQWTTVGTWTVTGGASTVVSMSPNSGTGMLQQFVFTVADSSSQTNISGMNVLFTSGAPTNIANACSIVYNRAAETVGLWDNTGNTTLATKGIGYSTLMENSQCSIQYTDYQFIGQDVLFTVQIQFLSAFTGPKSVYVQANEPNSNSGWVYIGTWTP